MKPVLLQPAYVLHRRPYRESSFLVDVFTKEQGRLTLIARGARKARSSRSSSIEGLLQPFLPLLVSFAGNGELATLSQVEVQGRLAPLQGECLFAGFYLNELLMRLLQKWDAHPRLYTYYEETLSALAAHHLEQKVLRLFEKRLLEELGYGLLPKATSGLQTFFSPECYYRFIPDQGLVMSEQRSQPGNGLFSGKSLLALANEEWPDQASLHDAKRLMRLVLADLLGARPLYSRKLFTKIEDEYHHEE